MKRMILIIVFLLSVLLVGCGKKGFVCSKSDNGEAHAINYVAKEIIDKNSDIVKVERTAITIFENEASSITAYTIMTGLFENEYNITREGVKLFAVSIKEYSSVENAVSELQMEGYICK